MSATLKLSTRTYRYADVRAAIDAIHPGAFDQMPFSHRIFAENIARRSPASEAPALLEHIADRRRDVDLPYFPARVILQDLLGTPALVDLAAGSGDVNPRLRAYRQGFDHSRIVTLVRAAYLIGSKR